MAKFVLRRKLNEMGIHDIEVNSAGTNAVDGIGPPEKAVEVCKQRGIDISSHLIIRP